MVAHTSAHAQACARSRVDLAVFTFHTQESIDLKTISTCAPWLGFHCVLDLSLLRRTQLIHLYVGIDTLTFSKIELVSAKEGTQQQSENGTHILSLLFSILRLPYEFLNTFISWFETNGDGQFIVRKIVLPPFGNKRAKDHTKIGGGFHPFNFSIGQVSGTDAASPVCESGTTSFFKFMRSQSVELLRSSISLTTSNIPKLVLLNNFTPSVPI